jgi:preprotein translocase subunit SecF
MTTTTNLSTARVVAAAFGCSVPTVMVKVKFLGIKFKGRTVAEHDALLAELEQVRPRARKAKAAPLTENQVLSQSIAGYLNQKDSLIAKVKDRITQIDLTRDVLNLEKAELLEQIRTLDPTIVPSAPSSNLNP